jgi:hypothetical protein
MMGNAQTSTGTGQCASTIKKATIGDDSTKSSLGKTNSGSSSVKAELTSKQLLKMFRSEEDFQKKEYMKMQEKIREFDPKVASSLVVAQKGDHWLHRQANKQCRLDL